MIRCFLRNACNYTTFEAAKIDSTLFRYMLYISKGTYDLVFTGNVTPNSIDCRGCHFSVLVVLFCKHSVLRSFCETCDEYTVIRTILTTVLRCKNQSRFVIDLVVLAYIDKMNAINLLQRVHTIHNVISHFSEKRFKIVNAICESSNNIYDDEMGVRRPTLLGRKKMFGRFETCKNDPPDLAASDKDHKG